MGFGDEGRVNESRVGLRGQHVISGRQGKVGSSLGLRCSGGGEYEAPQQYVGTSYGEYSTSICLDAASVWFEKYSVPVRVLEWSPMEQLVPPRRKWYSSCCCNLDLQLAQTQKR